MYTKSCRFSYSRFAVNVGQTSVLVPGTQAGLPSHIATLPQILSTNSYSTAMVGKWHLGHAQNVRHLLGVALIHFLECICGIVIIIR